MMSLIRLGLFSCIWIAVAASVTTGVLSIPPSLYWDGVDGAWSTFQIQVGTPGQTVRLLPGTSANAGNSIWVVIPEGCGPSINANITNCLDERGYVFTSNMSSSWSIQRLSNGGLYQLDTFEEGLLGLTGNAYYGFDTIQLGLDGESLPILSDQLIAGYATNSFWLGSLGLSPISFNFTNLDSPVPSMLSTLRRQSNITSTSWAYTAGAPYQSPPVFGSLTLGGYDSARFNASASLNAVPFGADFSRDLVVGIQSITHDALGSSPLLSNGIYAFIDSMATSMWLPISVCSAFEQAFNLTWNSTAGFYLLSSSAHAALIAQNPIITFKLGIQAASGGQTVDIRLPYAAFDLEISPPYVSEQSYYFPLQRAQNESQYTLGRVFLQEAYVIADYDRHIFQVAQAMFPSTEAGQKLVALSASSSQPSLGAGAIAGIVVGGVVLMTLVLIAVLLYVRRWRTRRPPPDEVLPSRDPYSVAAEKRIPAELSHDESLSPAEMSAGYAEIHEMGNNNVAMTELPAKASSLAHELPAGDVAREKDGTSAVL